MEVELLFFLVMMIGIMFNNIVFLEVLILVDEIDVIWGLIFGWVFVGWDILFFLLVGVGVIFVIFVVLWVRVLINVVFCVWNV